MAESNKGANGGQRGKRVDDPRRDLDPNLVPDMEAVERAVGNGDYAAFRRIIAMYENWLETRLGRWVQRYPELEAQLGNEIKIPDLVEEVFLNAFEHFAERPGSMRLRDWLEERIDPSVKQMLAQRDEELENINYVRSTLEARREQE